MRQRSCAAWKTSTVRTSSTGERLPSHRPATPVPPSESEQVRLTLPCPGLDARPHPGSRGPGIALESDGLLPRNRVREGGQVFPQELMRLGHCSLPNQRLRSSVEPGGLIRNKPQEDFSRITTTAGNRMDPVPSHTIQLFRTRCPGSMRSGPQTLLTGLLTEF